MNGPGTAVIIEDDADMRDLLEAVLRQSGFDVCSAADGRAGVELVRRQNANVVTLDVSLPDIDGFEVLRRIRSFSDAYVLMLTGRDEEGDVLMAFQGGADDYITKPFRHRELRARLTAVTRRPRSTGSTGSTGSTAGITASRGPMPSSTPAVSDDVVISHNGLELNHKTRTVMVHGRAVELTRSEFDLLHELLGAAGKICSTKHLVRVLRKEYSRDDTSVYQFDERAVQAHVGNLRRKLGDSAQWPHWVETVRGMGYRLAPARPHPRDKAR
ncbi:response regulator transcription factor [Arthrobacter sp. 9AX]|uniref:response regulator transcription factor n=1 Tax=Arthrobacter sp. 9AX TaxID=2653131 RepID=UPI0013577A73|nr:response regulator transcription factor [Arthrobacter sp. 9AX]